MSGDNVENPSTNGTNGRRADGTFAPGHKLAPGGNRYSHWVTALRDAMQSALTEEDIREIVRAMVAEAKAGDVQAATALLDRIFGKAKQSVDIHAEGWRKLISPDCPEPGSEP